MENKNLRKCVAENLRACQLRQVEILSIIDEICKRHQLNYWLDGGTLLGAVRHKGFIPWDDDLDIVMPLEDFNKFIDIARKELPADLFLQTKQNDPSSPHDFIKIRDMNSLFIEFRDDFTKEYQKGIYIDIFAFEPYPSVSRKVVHFITKRITKAYAILHAKHYYSVRSIAELFWFSGMYAILSVLWAIICLFSGKKKYLSYVKGTNGYGIMQRVDSIYPLSPIEFEGKLFSAPCNTDAYLKVLYNDYMTLPPPEDRRIHAVYINPCLYDGE